LAKAKTSASGCKPMYVWLVKLEEQVPTDPVFRPYRMSMLADALHSKGHTVTRWCSDYDHLARMQRFGKDHTVKYKSSYDIRFIHASVSYQKPVSLRRLLNNQLLYHKFHKQAVKAADQNKPDLIVGAMPTPSMAKACALLARKSKAPLVLDARDMWPDIIATELTGAKALLASPVIALMRKDLRFACREATGLVGITDFFLNYLLRYADRKAGPLDCVFELGFQPTGTKLNESISAKFWREQQVNLYDDVIIYFAGRLNSTISSVFEPVIQAARDLQQIHPRVKFVFCGSGQHRDKVTGMAEGCSNIILPGEIDHDNLYWLRKHSLAGIQPVARREDYQNSLSNKFFEYISSGLPVISWLQGISKELIEKHDCGYTYNSATELLQCITSLIESPSTRETLSRNALDLFKSRFEAEIIYQNFVNYLEDVTKFSSCGSP